jgi:pyruvate/2-oxoglutarate dehydrogenase complex dihydrolipoamide acyltransferase (E2) component
MPTSDESTPVLSTEAAHEAQGDAAGVLDAPAVHTDAGDGLSPAVRRLVRQYDLDVTGIHGTGPDGRIRVGDVIGMLGPRAEQAVKGVITPRPAPMEPDDSDAAVTEQPAAPEELAPKSGGAAVTTVFECDLSRVLKDRNRLRADNVELLLASYFVTACVEALAVVPEIAPEALPRIGVELTTAEGDTRPLKLTTDGIPAAPLSDRVRAVDVALRNNVDADLSDADLLVHHYGAGGSLLATPTPLRDGHVASLGVGRVRREIVLRNVDGDEAPRATARCYVSLSFLPGHVTLARANRFLAHAVRVLEQWPE